MPNAARFGYRRRVTITRREALLGLGAVVGGATLGCGGDADAIGDADAAASDARPDAPPPDAALDAVPQDAPSAAAMLANIDTFVVLMMENRSFDHYLGSLRLLEGRTGCDGLTGGEANPAPDGAPVPVFRLDDFTPEDPPHGWDACHAQWNQGANDGFVRAHAGASQRDVMGYHTRAQLPITYALADAGATCDRWFASVMGPTWPNRFFLHGATSNGVQSNLPALGFRSIFAALDDAGVSHKNYFHDVAWAVGGYVKLTGNAPIEDFFTAAAAGTLPTFSLIDPAFFGGGANDDHPSHDVRLGQALIAAVVNAMAASPQWGRSLLIITYDEHGGFFDHVPPPVTVDVRPEFRQLGFRVPTQLVGPTVRRGQIVSTPLEHVSIIATLANRFGLPPLTERVTATNDVSSCLDPATLHAPHPPPVLPPVPMARAAVDARPASDAHPELAAAVDALALPPELDRRGRAAEVTATFLDWATRLGAIRWVD